MGWEVLLDTVFEPCLLLDSSPVAISRIHNRQLLFIYFDCRCRKSSSLQEEVLEGRTAWSCWCLRQHPQGARAVRSAPLLAVLTPGFGFCWLHAPLESIRLLLSFWLPMLDSS